MTTACQHAQRSRPPLLQSDVTEAIMALESKQRLPANLWAAWIFDMTGIQTFPLINGSLALCTGGADGPIGTVLYLRPTEIARKIARRFDTDRQVLDRRQLADAIQWLEGHANRESAMAAAGLLDTRHQPPCGPADIRAAMNAATEPREVFDAELARIGETEQCSD